MTYGIGVLLDAGVILASDSRTNAGVDSVSTFRKMTLIEEEGRHTICLIVAGNLSLTQSALSQIKEWREGDDDALNIDKAKSMFRVARIVGAALREIHKIDAESLRRHNTDFNASVILGGQILGEPPRLFQIYAAGNFIEATNETPFFQIGETKYGKPVLDRLLHADMPLPEAAKLVLISFDSTIRSNLSVGLPIDLFAYEKDALRITHLQRLCEGSAYMTNIRRQWSEGLHKVFQGIAPPDIG